MGFRKFPEDYVRGLKWEKVMEIPQGKEIFMYRETEGIYVVIDMEKFYFLDLALARFVQMCALTHNGVAQILSHEDASRVVRAFKNDLRRWENAMEENLRGNPEKAGIKAQLWRISGYGDIIDNFLEPE